MPYAPQGGHGGGGAPSCFDRVKMGFMMGMCVGMCSGALLGGFGALRMGMRGGELVQNVGKIMVQGGGTFGTFMNFWNLRNSRNFWNL